VTAQSASAGRGADSPAVDRFAALPIDAVLTELKSTADGLTAAEATRRLVERGPNAVAEADHAAWRILVRQLQNPLLGLLAAATAVSFALGERTDAIIIVAIVTLSVGLGFFDEYRADQAARLLESRLTGNAKVLRGGQWQNIATLGIVPGDVIAVESGDIVAADARVLQATALEVDEAVVTGESLPGVKTPDAVADGARTSVLLAGTTVHAGRGRAIVVATGRDTIFGRVESGVRATPPVTEFQRGLRRFSLFLVSVTAVLSTFIFVGNAFLGRGFLESLLFSLAIAVGLTPQLLPAIVTVSLAMGGRRLATQRVIVRNLVAIEDLGNVEVLFSDKTGTLTSGTITLDHAADATDGGETLRWAAAWLVAGAHEATSNALEVALAADERVRAAVPSLASWTIVDELPFSYDKRMGGIRLADPAGRRHFIVKGAAEEVLAASTTGAAWGDGWHNRASAALTALLESGARVLAVAHRDDDGQPLAEQASAGLDLVGFLAFSDPPKPEAKAALALLGRLGIELKILTGDHPAVAKHVCERLELPFRGAVTGADLLDKSDAELTALVRDATVFARIDPEQKAILIRAAQRTGRDVGFLGDGVNDAPGLRQADVGISVDDATDVAKAAADVVLLEKDLAVLAKGVMEGRRTFANTVKYILMATSSNFGNMFSAAGASLFLSFLPMLPTQILLNNFLYDVSELTLPTDAVDDELTRRPAHWDIHMIARFMLVFGPASSLYDFLTFGLMLWVFDAGESRFQSGWFVESFCTQTLVIFVLRTRRVPFWRSRPSMALLATTLVCVAIAIAIPFSPLNGPLNFEALPLTFILALGAMVVTYLILVEAAKHLFYQRWPTGASGSANEPRPTLD
jgi:P-type Mg2+ transporter